MKMVPNICASFQAKISLAAKEKTLPCCGGPLASSFNTTSIQNIIS